MPPAFQPDIEFRPMLSPLLLPLLFPFLLELFCIPLPHLIPEDLWTSKRHGWTQDCIDACRWSANLGDCISRLIFIVVNMKKQTIEHELGKALLSVAEIEALGGIEGWNKLEDLSSMDWLQVDTSKQIWFTSHKMEGALSSRSVLNKA